MYEGSHSKMESSSLSLSLSLFIYTIGSGILDDLAVSFENMVFRASIVAFFVTITVAMGGICCCCLAANPLKQPHIESEKERSPEELYSNATLAWNSYMEISQSEGDRRTALLDAVRAYQAALALAPKGHHLRHDVLLGLTFALLDQCQQTPDLASLAKVEEYFEELEEEDRSNGRAMKAPPGYAYAVTIKLGGIYYSSFTSESPSHPDPGVFHRYVSNCLKAAEYSEDSKNKTKLLLAVAYEHYKLPAYVQKALEYYQRARITCPPSSHDLLLQISRGIYTIRLDRYWESGRSRDDLEAAITECKTQLELHTSSSTKANTLVNLADCIWVLSERHSSEIDCSESLKDAVRYIRKAIRLIDRSPAVNEKNKNIRTRASTLLAHTLSSRHGSPATQDLDEAIAIYRKGLEGAHQDADILSHLAGALWLRCDKAGERTEDETTLQSAIDLYKRALDNSDNAKVKSSIANNIAAIYIERASSNVPNVEDLEMAQQFYVLATRLCADPNDKAYYEDQAKLVRQNVDTIKGTGTQVAISASPQRKPTPRRQSTQESF